MVLSEDALPYWNGADEPGMALVPGKPGSLTDYDRACAIHGYVGAIPVGPSEGLVLADEPLDTLWWKPHGSEDLLLVRWVSASSDERVLQSLSEFDPASLSPSGMAFHPTADRLVLFDSSMPGTDIITGYATAEFQRGTHHVELGRFKPAADTELIVLRLARAQ